MIESWAVGICLVAVASAMLQFLLPSGSTAKLVRLVMGALVLCVLIAPLKEVVPEVSEKLDHASSQKTPDSTLSKAVDDQYVEAAKSSIVGLVKSELKKKSLSCTDVSVLMDNSEDGSIHITKVIVTLPISESASKEEIREFLAKSLGLETEVKTDGS
jgi:hypothetical protein